MSEMAEAIDLNRGFIYTKTLDGVTIGYYADDPCHFYAQNGMEVPETMALHAFPPETLAQLRKKCAYNQRIKQASDAIQAELDADVSTERPVVEERGGLKVIDIGLGRGRVEDEDGQPMHTQSLSTEQAVKLLHNLVPDVPGVPETGKKPGKQT